MKRYFKNSYFNFGFFVVSILLALFALSFIYIPYDPNAMDLERIFAPPSIAHIFGTDEFGRDLFSRIVDGSRVIYLVGFCAVSAGLLVGVLIGSIAGYFGGWTDEILMKIIDTKMAFPGVLLALMLIAIFGTSITNLIVAIGIIGIPKFARITRAGYMKYKQYDFVKASRSRGASHFRIMYIHILPNLFTELLITATLGFSSAIMAEAGLSYLGLGIQPPDPSWGQMLSNGQRYLGMAPWYPIIPGLFITLTVLGFNMLADGLRDVK